MSDQNCIHGLADLSILRRTETSTPGQFELVLRCKLCDARFTGTVLNVEAEKIEAQPRRRVYEVQSMHPSLGDKIWRNQIWRNHKGTTYESERAAAIAFSRYIWTPDYYEYRIAEVSEYEKEVRRLIPKLRKIEAATP